MSIFGSESKFESSIKQIPYPQQAVYNNISDEAQPVLADFNKRNKYCMYFISLKVSPNIKLGHTFRVQYFMNHRIPQVLRTSGYY